MTALDDLARFARVEVASRDVEPWAELLAALYRSAAVDVDEALWLVSLYNTYDALDSALAVFRRWRSPEVWQRATDAEDAADYPCTQERRGLRGGRVLRRLDSYASKLDGLTQWQWVTSAARGLDPVAGWTATTAHLRGVWGVGRQSAFEWAEFLAKVVRMPIEAPDADLWESEGPRRSLQRLYGNDSPTLDWLNEHAELCRRHLARHGAALSWVDFETVICDFNVMRDGRYYPGRHLAALREELDSQPDDPLTDALNAAWRAVVPPPWVDIAPGIDKALLPHYKLTGQIRSTP